MVGRIMTVTPLDTLSRLAVAVAVAVLLPLSCASAPRSGPRAKTILRGMNKVSATRAPADVRAAYKKRVCGGKPLVERKPVPYRRPLYVHESDSEGTAVIESGAEFAAVFGCKGSVDWKQHRVLLVWYSMTDRRPIAFKAGRRRGAALSFDLRVVPQCKQTAPIRSRAARLILLPADGSPIEVRQVEAKRAEAGCPPSAPTEASACKTSGKVCFYAACGGAEAVCKAGRWRIRRVLDK